MRSWPRSVEGWRSLSSRSSSARRSSGSEGGQLVDAEGRFDGGDGTDRVFEAGLAQLLVLDLFEAFADFVELLGRDHEAELGEEDRVLARGVRAVHAGKGADRVDYAFACIVAVGLGALEDR